MKVVNANELEQTLQQNAFVLVDFFATWCGPCKMLAPELEKLAEKLSGKLEIVKVDVDESADLAMKYGVMSVPTMYLFQNGKAIKQMVGYKPMQQLESEIALFLK